MFVLEAFSVSGHGRDTLCGGFEVSPERPGSEEHGSAAGARVERFLGEVAGFLGETD